MKQRDISSFFGKAPSSTAAAAAVAKPAKQEKAASKQKSEQSPTKRPGDGEGNKRLKRLRRACDAEQAKDAPAEQQDLEDVEDEELADAPAAAEAKPAASPAAAEPKPAAAGKAGAAAAAAPADAGGSQAAAAKGADGSQGEAKVSNKEASSAFKQMFAGSAKGKGSTAAAKGRVAAAAASPAKQKPQQATPEGKSTKRQQKSVAAAAAADTLLQDKEEQQQQLDEQQADGADAAAVKAEAAAAAAAAGDSDPAAAAASDDASDSADEEMEDLEAENASDEDAEAADEDEADEQAKFKAAFKQAPAGKKKTSKKAAAGSSAVEGVGTGALAAAKLAVTVDVQKLVTWKEGAPVPYAFLAETFETIATTSKRLEIISALTSAFRAILAGTPGDLLPAVYLCTNRVAPAHAGIELGVGDAILIKALASATGRKESSIKSDYETSGDLGSVAASCRSAQRTLFTPAPLTIAAVLKTFREIAKESGQSSQERKKGLISKLLVASKGCEPGYIMRSLQAKLRIGLAEQSVLVAIAHAVLLHKEGAKDKDGKLADRLEQASQAVKAAYSECPSYDMLIPALLDHPLSELAAHVHFMPGVPVKPMLAKPTTGVGEVLDKFTDCEFTCEYKYDGERVQIHVLDGGKTVHIYSRNAEDMTPRYPDILARLPSWLAPGTDSIVIDGEAVAWDPEKAKILPFQVLSTRARKEVALADVKVQVCVYAFDCLYHNGASLLHEPLTKRRQLLHDSLVEVPGQLAQATTKISNDVEELEAFLNEAVDASTEGLIVKTLGDTYEPSRRSSHWLKLKKDYLAGVGDTFDVVPIGAFYGRGKRAGVFGAYLLAVYDDENEAYQTISKLGTGFSEEQLVQLADSLRPAIIPKPRSYYKYGESGAPDVWFEPTHVWEVKAADLSISPLHQAAMGLVEPGKGISIRFPRLVRVRDDKSPEDATTAGQVADMYRQQAVVAAEARSKAKAGDDDEA
uniref:DNA ligase n=1 Tax=Tetradesmus obliquus TaxID=3088 RepID=A0A383WI45_TETOB|eukprot:jgi/Sobl393_1/8276/SZX76913.1